MFHKKYNCLFSIFILFFTLIANAATNNIAGGFVVSKNKLLPIGQNGFKLNEQPVSINDSYVTLDGLNNSFIIPNSEDIDCENGMTIFIKCRWKTMPNNKPLNKQLDAFAFKEDQFIFARQDNRIYINFFNGQKWKATTYSSPILPKLDDSNFHTLVMTVKRHLLVDQGEDRLETTAYLDGKVVINKKISQYRVNKSQKSIELASGKKFGPPWKFGGDIAEIKVFSKVLNPAEIKKISNIKPVKITYPAGKKIVMKSNNTVLTLLESTNFVHPISLYDKIAKREILANGARFFSIDTRKGLVSVKVSPLAKEVKSKFIKKPILQNNVWSFSIAYQKVATPNSPVTFDAICNYTYSKDRLEYTLEVKNVTNGKINNVNYPDLQFNPLLTGKDYMLVPQMCGIAYENAAKRNVYYGEIYPRGMASMQCGAFYDSCGGIYISPADPNGLVKTINFSASSELLEAFTSWEIYTNTFKNNAKAAVEIFRGNWYDVGLIYRKELAKNNSMWWVKNLKDVDTPQWMKNSTWSMNVTFPYISEQNIIKLSKYFETPPTIFLWGWWEEGGSSLGPNIRTTPEVQEFYRELQKHGIRITPYINGRLWPKYDRQGEDFEYTKIGLAAAIDNNGKLATENYSSSPCVILCPSTKTYFDRIPKLALKVLAFGADGVYVDQIGAAAAFICTSNKHNHKAGDLKFWYTNGHYPTYNAIRKHRLFKGKILSTEDHSETCVGIFDTMLPWRWLYNEMVPLFPMVFSGRTQFYGRDSASLNAPYTKTAMMLNNGEQLGWFNHILLSPLNSKLRRFVKRLIHTRIAMLPFFNYGMMARPVELTTFVPQEKEFWGNHGDKFVTMKKIQTSLWKLDNNYALIIVNTSDKKLSGSLKINLPKAKYQALRYSSFADKQKYDVNGNIINYQLAPYENQIIYFYLDGKCNEKLKNNFDKSFTIIKKAVNEEDPFAFNVKNNPYKGKILNPYNWQDSGKSYYISGAKKQPNGGLYWIANSIIGAGKYDFGTQCKGFEIELVRLSGFSSKGKIRFCLNGIEEKDTIAQISVDSNTLLSKNTQDWKIIKTQLSKEISGVQNLYLVFEGFSFCNVKNWRATK